MFAYVGCRTTRERNARGRGIGVFQVDEQSRCWAKVQCFEGLTNPSYLLLERSGRFLYCLHGDMGEASAFAVDPVSGRIAHLNTVDCGGRNPVHLIEDATGHFLIIANFATGTLGVLPRNADGSLAPLVSVFTIPGDPGPHRTQQKGMHPHQVVYDPDRKLLLVPDKGGDKVSLFTCDAVNGRLAAHNPAFVPARSGAAPRHMAFHPSLPFAWLVNELDSTIAAYRWDQTAGKLTPLQIVPSIPDTFTADNTGAGIAVSSCGRFLYSSNRGHDSIAIFAIHSESGLLSALDWEPTRGSQPRFFTLSPDGRFLYAANEASDNIECFLVADDGMLRWQERNTIRFGSPTCIVFSSQAPRSGHFVLRMR